MGTVISHASKDRIAEMVNASVKEGAKILTGGDCPGVGLYENNVNRTKFL
jgi:acyl-CoA reductase-like NAD-dependent aldehyde dehydrogenase